MPLLAEYAITPDVFETAQYSHADVAGLHLSNLKRILLEEAVLRDLRHGDWARAILANRDVVHRKGIELLKKLKDQGRLYPSNPSNEVGPATALDWCREAIESHVVEPLNGIFTMQGTADSFARHEHKSLLGVVGKLEGAFWWSQRGCSVRLERTIDDYLKHLDLILTASNSLMFIDPHIDPEGNNYRDFPKLLEQTIRRGKHPLIEIHRVCYTGWERKILTRKWEKPFREWLGELASRLGIKIEVFIWDQFHDRYLISNLIGISLPNGFDTTTSLNARTTWVRLDRAVRDDVQKEFARESTRHFLHHSFSLP